MPALLNALSPALIAAFVMWAVSVLLILVDIYNARRRRQQDKTVNAWYARPLPWFASCGFPFGTFIAVLPWITFPSQFWWMLFLILFLLTIFFLGGGLFVVVRWDMQQVARKEEVLLRRMVETNPRSVAASRPAGNLVASGSLVMALVIIVLGPISLVQFYFHHVPPGLLIWPLVAYVAMMAWIVSWSSTISRFYKRINTQKMALAAEHGRALREAAFEEPLQIALSSLVIRLKGSVIVRYLILLALLLFILFFPTSTNNIDFFITALFCAPIFLFYLLRGWRERVETTTRSLAVVRGILFASSRQEIPWQEARLFTCYPSFSLLKRRTTMVYELSSAVRTVRWTRVVNLRSPLTFWKPQLPPEEYSRQTEELCEFVYRMTGLQLHDLSEDAGSQQKAEVVLQIPERDK